LNRLRPTQGCGARRRKRRGMCDHNDDANFKLKYTTFRNLSFKTTSENVSWIVVGFCYKLNFTIRSTECTVTDYQATRQNTRSFVS